MVKNPRETVVTFNRTCHQLLSKDGDALLEIISAFAIYPQITQIITSYCLSENLCNRWMACCRRSAFDAGIGARDIFHRRNVAAAYALV